MKYTFFGYEYEDTVCIDSGFTQCVSDFSFYAILEEQGGFEFDGIMGLAPSVSGNGPSLLFAL